MRHIFVYDNPDNKETIEIGVYFKHEYSSELFDFFFIELRKRISGWLQVGSKYENFGKAYMKSRMQFRVQQAKEHLHME